MPVCPAGQTGIFDRSMFWLPGLLLCDLRALQATITYGSINNS